MAAARSRAGPVSVSAAASSARAWSRSRPTVVARVGIDPGPAYRGGGVGADQVVFAEVAAPARHRRQPPRHARGGGAGVEQAPGPQVDVDAAGLEDVDLSGGEPVQPGGQVGGVGAPGAGRAVAGQPGRGHHLIPGRPAGQHRVLDSQGGQQLAGHLGTAGAHQRVVTGAFGRGHGQQCDHQARQPSACRLPRVLCMRSVPASGLQRRTPTLGQV